MIGGFLLRYRNRKETATDDIRTVVKELRRIADAGEKIAKTLEKQNRAINFAPDFTLQTTVDENEA